MIRIVAVILISVADMMMLSAVIIISVTEIISIVVVIIISVADMMMLSAVIITSVADMMMLGAVIIISVPEMISIRPVLIRIATVLVSGNVSLLQLLPNLQRQFILHQFIRLVDVVFPVFRSKNTFLLYVNPFIPRQVWRGYNATARGKLFKLFVIYLERNPQRRIEARNAKQFTSY